MIPRPKIGEGQGLFISRCSKELILQGTPNEQAIEICMGRWMLKSDPLEPTLFEETTEMTEAIYYQTYFESQKLFKFTYLNIGGSVGWGYGLPSDFSLDKAKYKTAKDFKSNVEFFSGAKTKDHVKELNKAVFSEKGQKLPFREYRDIAKGINEKYNINWLKTEMNQAFSVAQSKEHWEGIQEEKHIFPYLQYITVNDGRVRPEHASWDKVIKPVDDPFWNSHYPPNGWNCRCTVVQLTEGKDTTNKDKLVPNTDPYWNGNTGKGTQIYKKTGIPYTSKPKDGEFQSVDDYEVKRQMIKIWQ